MLSQAKKGRAKDLYATMARTGTSSLVEACGAVASAGTWNLDRIQSRS